MHSQLAALAARGEAAPWSAADSASWLAEGDEDDDANVKLWPSNGSAHAPAAAVKPAARPAALLIVMPQVSTTHEPVSNHHGRHP